MAPGMMAPLGSLTTTRSEPSTGCAQAGDSALVKVHPPSRHTQRSLRITAAPRQSVGAGDGKSLRVDLWIDLDLVHLPFFIRGAFLCTTDRVREVDAVHVAPVLEEEGEVHHRRRLCGFQLVDLLVQF